MVVGAVFWARVGVGICGFMGTGSGLLVKKSHEAPSSPDASVWGPYLASRQPRLFYLPEGALLGLELA